MKTTLKSFILTPLLCVLFVSAETHKNSGEIEIIFDEVPVKSSQVEESDKSTQTKNAYRIHNMPLNDFVLAMAQKGALTYVANPKVTGNVSGRFNQDSPLEMIKVAARANGYAVQINESSIELYNADTLAALPQQVYTRQLKYLRVPGKPEDQQKKMQELFKGFLSTDRSQIQFDSKTNTLVVRDVDSNISLLDSMITKLDVDRPNVLVRVTAVEVDANPRRMYGIDWNNTFGEAGLDLSATTVNSLASLLTTQFVATTATSAMPSNPDYALVLQPGQVKGVLRALENKGLAEIRARFFVSTEDNESGMTTVARQEPIPTFSANQQTGGFDITGFQYKPIGATLQVTPQLLPDNIVRLAIRPSLSSSNQTRTFTSNNGGFSASVPIIEERSTEVTVRVPLNKSLMLGGLQQLFGTDQSNKVPILGDIPLIKFFFSSRDYEKRTRNLILVVEPGTLDPQNPQGIEDEINKIKDQMKYLPKDFNKPISDLSAQASDYSLFSK
jgi:type II secretory pathway component GspD/PulD (secretin)